MMFDIQTIGIVCFCVFVSAAVLLIISMVVTKEKTYEEAIAEQRQQTNALLATHTKQKPKEKKQKKAGKKVKEKTNPIPVEQDVDEVDATAVEQPVESTVSSQVSSNPSKHHVEFKEPTVLEEQPAKDVNKKEGSPKREIVKEKVVKEKVNVTQEVSKAKKVAKLQTVETTTQTNPMKEELPVQQVTQITQTNGLVPHVGKEKKKKKTEQNILEQLTADKDGLNLQLLSSLVRKAELSRSEVQILIDMLLNKQHEAPAIIDEWSEGKADPVQKLKKQLAEKEKLLQEEQEALVSAQAKLKEVRSEQIAEKSQLQQKMRGMEEALNAKQLELQSVNARLAGTQQKLQPLQDQLNNEVMKSHKLMEENGAYQMQIQQMQHIITQAQEKELANEHQQNLLAQLQQQTAFLKADADQKDDYIRKMEEARKELENRCHILQHQENEMQVEISQLNATCQKQIEEIRISEMTKVQALGELQNLKKYKEESDEIISKLQSEVVKLEEEKRQNDLSRESGVMEEKKAHQVEVKNLQNELTSLKLEIQEKEKRFNANLEATVKKLQNELEEQKDKNNEAISKIRLEEQNMNKIFIERLFPNIKINDNLPHEKWCEQVQGAISRYINELQRPKTPEPVDNTELIKLQNENQKYKLIIDDTEGMLNNLQNHVEQTEIQWRKQLELKDKEMETIQMKLKQLHEQLADMEQRLAKGEEEKRKALNENDAVKQAQIDRLNEAISNLNQQLDESVKKNIELQSQLDSLNNLAVKGINNHNNTSNGPAVTVENNGN